MFMPLNWSSNSMHDSLVSLALGGVWEGGVLSGVHVPGFRGLLMSCSTWRLSTRPYQDKLSGLQVKLQVP